MKPLPTPWNWIIAAAVCAFAAYPASDNWAVRAIVFVGLGLILLWFVKRHQRKVDGLRAKARGELGDRYEQANFDAMLSSANFTNGSLDHQVETWIAAVKAKP